MTQYDIFPMLKYNSMEQLRRDVSEVIALESLNVQRIEKLSEGLVALNNTIRDSITRLATSLATQSQALVGFRELYAKEIGFIHQSLEGMKESLDTFKDVVRNDKEKINAVEKDIAVARGSIKGIVISWSGFVALLAFIADKALELFGRR